MQAEQQLSFLGSELKAPESTVKLGVQERSTSRRAQPPAKWSLRVDLPLVREGMQDVNGSPVRARTPVDVAALCAEIGQFSQEAFIVLDVNAKNNVIDKRLVTLGIADASLVHPREVFRGAIQSAAAAVICCHGHPSGDVTPSAEDIRITRQLVDAGRILDIRVLDHVIIGRPGAAGPGTPGFLSLREAGLVSFEK